MTVYHLRAGEDLACGERRFFLGRLVCILLVGQVQAGGAAGALVLLQGRSVPLVNTVQRAPADSPVEIVHTFTLEKQDVVSKTQVRVQVANMLHQENMYPDEKHLMHHHKQSFNQPFNVSKLFKTSLNIYT